MEFIKKLKQEYNYTVRSLEYSMGIKQKPLFVRGAGLRSGKALMDGLVHEAQSIWKNQIEADKEGVNAVVILTMGRSQEESMVTMVFNPSIQCNANNMPELEAETYVKASEYLEGACVNRSKMDERVRMALDRMVANENVEVSIN